MASAGDAEGEGEGDKCAGWEHSLPVQSEGQDRGAGQGCSEGQNYTPPGRGLGVDSASRPAVPDLLLDSAAAFGMHVPTFISSF